MKVCLQACSILITLAKDSYTRKYVVKVSLEEVDDSSSVITFNHHLKKNKICVDC